MPVHKEKRVLPYSPEQLYALVVDIERYPEFLPWCLAARIKDRREELIVADLVIGFYVDFEFRNKLLQRVIEALFHEAVRRMVAAFETRARDLYGLPSAAPSSQRS